MAADAVAVMAALGHTRFRVVGHDRGGRVGYRMALDHVAAVEKLSVIDIVPTHAMWLERTVPQAMGYYHWLFLAQPAPFPERMIGADPVAFIDHTLASWTKAKSLVPFVPAALAAYRAFFSEPARLSATCHDYRAGATADLAHDIADMTAGRRIACPVLALWGAAGIPAKGPADPASSPLETWRRWAPDVRGAALDTGHFVPEEDPDGTLRALLAFL
jgi:haloacetate dehalogenase